MGDVGASGRPGASASVVNTCSGLFEHVNTGIKCAAGITAMDIVLFANSDIAKGTDVLDSVLDKHAHNGFVNLVSRVRLSLIIVGKIINKGGDELNERFSPGIVKAS